MHQRPDLAAASTKPSMHLNIVMKVKAHAKIPYFPCPFLFVTIVAFYNNSLMDRRTLEHAVAHVLIYLHVPTYMYMQGNVST